MSSGGQTTGKRAMVVAGHPLAVDAGLRILDLGGSATDALIASAAVLCVVLPQAVTLGGDAFGLFYDAAGRSVHGLNASGRSPRATDPAHFTSSDLERGARASTVPALVRGWETAHARFGRLAWPQLFEPAIEAADNGVAASRVLVKALQNNLQLVAADADLEALLIPGGRPLRAGEVFRQPALARTLRAISNSGASAFYEGAIARALVARLRREGGLFDIDDLARCAADWTEPLAASYRGHTAVTVPPNSFGILGLLQLQRIEASGVDLATCSDGQRFTLLVEAAEDAFARAGPYLADPDAIAGDPKELLRNSIGHDKASDPGLHSAGTAVTMAVDSEGNAAILVESIFTLFGSGVFDAETGILLNNRMRGFSFDPGSSNVLAAGKRPAHTLSPFMLLQDGALRMVLGSPGGPGQTITLVQAITNHIDRHLSMTQAIAEPRWSYDLDRRVILEQGVSDAVAVALAELSIEAIRPPSETPYFGSVKAITVDGDGLHGFTDPRREAAAGGR